MKKPAPLEFDLTEQVSYYLIPSRAIFLDI